MTRQRERSVGIDNRNPALRAQGCSVGPPRAVGSALWLLIDRCFASSRLRQSPKSAVYVRIDAPILPRGAGFLAIRDVR